MENAAHKLEPVANDVPAIAGRISPAVEITNGIAREKHLTSPLSANASEGPADRVLVQRVLAGDRAAFDMVIARYQRQAVAVSYRLLGNTQDALDVTQDAFLKAFNSLATLQNPDALGGWMMRIVSNLSLNYRRGRKTRSKAQLPLDDILSSDGANEGEWSSKSADPMQAMASREMGAKLKDALASLPDKQRAAIVMFTIEQMPQKDVAEALKCSVEAVKWHVFQGRKKLKELLKDHL
jgi:RNA polymerase sigma-70 factor (ECF subfamily)